MNFGSFVSLQLASAPDYASTPWYANAVAFKERYGRQAFEQAWLNGQLSKFGAAPPDEGASQFLSFQLARWQDNGNGWDSIVDHLTPAMAVFALTTGLGGMTAAEAVTGGDPIQGVKLDVLGLAAGAGLAQVLPAVGLSTITPVTTTSVEGAVYGEVAASGVDFGVEGTGYTLTEATGVTPLIAEQTGAVVTAGAAVSATASAVSAASVSGAVSSVSAALSTGKKIISLVEQLSGSKKAIQPAYLPQQNRSTGLLGTLYNTGAGEDIGPGAGQFNPVWLIAGVLAVVFLFFGTFLLRSR